MNEFFRVESKCQIISFRLSEVVAVELPNRPHKPAGWCDEFAALVYLRNRTDCIGVTPEQWEQLKPRLEASEPRTQSSGIEYL